MRSTIIWTASLAARCLSIIGVLICIGAAFGRVGDPGAMLFADTPLGLLLLLIFASSGQALARGDLSILGDHDGKFVYAAIGIIINLLMLVVVPLACHRKLSAWAIRAILFYSLFMLLLWLPIDRKVGGWGLPLLGTGQASLLVAIWLHAGARTLASGMREHGFDVVIDLPLAQVTEVHRHSAKLQPPRPKLHPERRQRAGKRFVPPDQAIKTSD